MLTETKAKGEKADIIITQFNFQHTTKVDADGLSGGIYILWNDQADVQPVVLIPQEIYLNIKVSSPPFFFFLSAIYSKPYLSYKHALWKNLENFANNWSDPWLVLGDFNEITSTTEKFGGLPQS